MSLKVRSAVLGVSLCLVASILFVIAWNSSTYWLGFAIWGVMAGSCGVLQFYKYNFYSHYQPMDKDEYIFSKAGPKFCPKCGKPLWVNVIAYDESTGRPSVVVYACQHRGNSSDHKQREVIDLVEILENNSLEEVGLHTTESSSMTSNYR